MRKSSSIRSNRSGTKPGGNYQGAIDAARSGVVTIFAAGNDGNLNNPDAMAGPSLFRAGDCTELAVGRQLAGSL